MPTGRTRSENNADANYSAVSLQVGSEISNVPSSDKARSESVAPDALDHVYLGCQFLLGKHN